MLTAAVSRRRRRVSGRLWGNEGKVADDGRGRKSDVAGQAVTPMRDHEDLRAGLEELDEVLLAANNGQAGAGPLRPDWVVERLAKVRSRYVAALSRLEAAERVVAAAVAVVDADAYRHPVLSREQAVGEAVAELHDAVAAWQSIQPPVLDQQQEASDE